MEAILVRKVEKWAVSASLFPALIMHFVENSYRDIALYEKNLHIPFLQGTDQC